MRRRILILCDYYLPGYKTGGGMWMAANLVERFADDYDFFVVTRNHDGRSDTRPYAAVTSDEWNSVGSSRVFYFSPERLTAGKVVELVSAVSPDAVYLNSAFSLPTRQFLRGRRRAAFHDLPVILAPCGEMSERAMSNKPLRKKLFLTAARAVGFYHDLIWKASGDEEAADIRRVFGSDPEILIAPELLPMAIFENNKEIAKPIKKAGSCRLIYVARIVPNKNLKYLLHCLSEIHEGRIKLEIIGPREDTSYWNECERLIAKLPANISVQDSGALPNDEALARLAASHFFALPTENENFGYVFLEALAMGCPLVISDRTIWNEIEDHNAGWCVPLSDEARYVARIKQCIQMPAEEYSHMSTDAREYADAWLSRDDAVAANLRVLETALERSAKPQAAFA